MVIRDLSQQGPSNRGGAYVTDYRVETAPSGHVLYISGPEGSVVQARLTDPRYQPRGFGTLLGQPLDGAGTHPPPATLTLLELLRGAVTVPCGNSVDFAIALDWFKKVVDGALDGYTDLADLVNRGKRCSKRPEDRAELRTVGQAILGEMVEFISQHPLLKGVDAIAAVPGHDARVLSFGSSLAFAVARERNVRLIRCVSTQDYRPEAKQISLADRAAALEGRFECPVNVLGQRVLIVDDVYSSGATAQETARVLRGAGAVSVASLTAVRTMRSL